VSVAARPLLGLRIDDAQVLALPGTPEPGLLDALPIAVVVLGAARFDRHDDVRLDPSAAAAWLQATLPTTSFLVAASVQHDHPYNLARRIATDDHIAGGRVGLLLGLRDEGSPREAADVAAWGGARLGTGVPLDAQTVGDAADVIRRLWQSWPIESVIADREHRVFARAEEIRLVETRGRFPVRGPFTVPTTPQGSPVLAVQAHPADLARIAEPGGELVIAPEGIVPETSAPVLVEHRWTDEAALRRALDVAAADGRRGLVLDASGAGLEAVLDVVGRVLADGHAAAAAGETLRDRVGLDRPADLLTGSRAAFAS
jgi:alkanesulfonate monooxygenase SsuD/methylene tetrahydromethanopterin reductase-like flavin-dependent oxidoreductase (luciferase family)